jgi:hypothetical protein
MLPPAINHPLPVVSKAASACHVSTSSTDIDSTCGSGVCVIAASSVQ